MTLAFGAVAATCATTAALRVGLPPMAPHTRGVSWSPPAATPTHGRRLARSAGPTPRLASLGAGADPQVPPPGGGASADRTAGGAAFYQPDWEEIDLGDDRGGDGDEGEERDTRDMDAFEGAFGDGDGGLANAPRLRSLDRASRDAEASERAWDAEASENFADEKGSRYEDAYENGLDARLELDGDAYEASLRGDLDASYADAERAERRRRVKIARRREHARDLDLYEAKKSRAEAGRGRGRGRGGRARGGVPGCRDAAGGRDEPPDSYFDYDAPDYVPPSGPRTPAVYDYDYAPYDYDYDYGARRAGTGTGARGRGRRRGGAGTRAGRGPPPLLTGREPGGRSGTLGAFPASPAWRSTSRTPGMASAPPRGRRASWFRCAPASGAWRTCSSRL